MALFFLKGIDNMKADSVWLVKDMIEKSKRQFIVPVYQRNYDWSISNCKKLFEDIILAYNEDRKHFTGTIVYIKGSHSSKFDEDIIIDGQQRITTILILLKAILDKAILLSDYKLQSEIPDYLFNRDSTDEMKIKLKPVKSDSIPFSFLMKNHHDEMSSESNISKNYNYFMKVIENELSKGISLSDILYGVKRLEVVEIILDTDKGDDPQTIFESINSTGLDLSAADLIRNFLLMNDGDQEKLYEEYWLPIERIISKGLLVDYFTDYLNFKSKENISSSNIYEKFKDFYKKNNYSNQSMMTELKYYSNIYSVFVFENNRYSHEINKSLSDLRLLDQSTIYPFLLPVFEDFDKKQINEYELQRVLKFFVNYSLRRIITGVPSNSLRGLYKTLYNRVFKDSENKKTFYKAIHSFFMQLNTKDRVPSDDEFMHSLVYNNLYQKKNVCKYLLTSIENDGSNETIDVKSLTIEHVMPQSLTSKWKADLGSEYEDVWSKYLHTLGNLTITGYNSELGNDSFENKQDIIRTRSKARILNEDILSKSTWSAYEIENRAKVLAKKILQMFHFEELDIPIVFNEINGNSFTTSDAEKTAYTKPIDFYFCGDKFYVKSYKQMTVTLFETLFLLDDSIMVKLAENNYAAFSSRITMSYDKKILRNPQEIKDSGIFIETNLSSYYHVLFIEKILEEYGFDESEFYFHIINTQKDEDLT